MTGVRLSFVDLIRHARLEDPYQLGACLDKISWGFRELHGDASAQLFAVDPRGSVYFPDLLSYTNKSGFFRRGER
jgi:hypothetical protein